MTDAPSVGFQAVLSKIVTQLKLPSRSLSHRNRKEIMTSNQFYHKPYTNCRQCQLARFKCKACIGAMVLHLKQYKQQQQQLMEQRKSSYIRQLRLRNQPPKQSKLEQEILPLQQQPQESKRLQDLRKGSNPTLHQNILELPLHDRERAGPASPVTMFILENRRYKSLSSISPFRAEPSEDRAQNRLSIQTIQVPLQRLSNQPVKMSMHAKNLRMKPLPLSKRKQKNLDSEALLPVIRQLSIQDREIHVIKKERITMMRPAGKKSLLNEFTSVPFTAWQQHGQHHDYRQEDDLLLH